MGSITRTKKTVRTDQKVRVTALLLEATERLIAKGSSFTELSVEKLSREAGIARSTYYLYFKDKGQLIQELGAVIAAELLQTTQRWWDISSQVTLPQLRRAMRETLKIYLHYQAVFASMAETAGYDAEVRSAFDQLLEAMTSNSLQALREGQRRGTIHRDVTEDSYMALVWMTERFAYHRVRRGGEAELERAARILANIIWRALYPPARTR
ncbi:MAG TPA: helix-turn-helix domain-containing protein [Nevskia sp.]|nr:helix-turn-helix domain-containing protein [Nevskia sp.]